MKQVKINFVGAEQWIKDTLEYCDKFNNGYLFQTKNPKNIRRILPYNSKVCITLETNRWYGEIMKYSPMPIERSEQMFLIRHPLYVTIEPIIDFDLWEFIELLNPSIVEQINIGADSGNNHLPEPPKEKILELISELEKFTKVKQKSNLTRLLK